MQSWEVVVTSQPWAQELCACVVLVRHVVPCPDVGPEHPVNCFQAKIEITRLFNDKPIFFAFSW